MKRFLDDAVARPLTVAATPGSIHVRRLAPRLVILFPISLVLALLPLPYAGFAARVLILVSVLPAMGFLRMPLRGAERWWLVVNLLYLFGASTSSVILFSFSDHYPASDSSELWYDLARQYYIVAIATLLLLTFRSPHARRSFASGMTLFVFVGSSLIIGGYARFAGARFPDYYTLRQFKDFATESLGMAVNPLSFAIVLAFVISYPSWSRKLWFGVPLGFLVLLSMFLSGSRATIVAVVLSVVAIRFVGLLQRFPRYYRWYAYTACSLFVVVLFSASPPLRHAVMNPYDWSEWTTGRLDLWIAGLTKFAERPVTGWGAGSWHADLYYYLPDYRQWGRESLTVLESGGFHSVYITVLAEKGMLGFLPGMLVLGLLAAYSTFLFRARKVVATETGVFATVLPFLFALLVLRGASEHAGLLAYGNGIVDFVAYATAALIAAVYEEYRASRLPSHKRFAVR
jgi:O-antigen ligase